MRLQVSYFVPLAALAALALNTGTCAQAQSTASPTAGNGTYIASDPLASVRYDNRYDLSLDLDRKSTRLNSSHRIASRMPSSA